LEENISAQLLCNCSKYNKIMYQRIWYIIVKNSLSAKVDLIGRNTNFILNYKEHKMKKSQLVTSFISATVLSVALVASVNAAPVINYSGSSCQVDKSAAVRRTFSGALHAGSATWTTVNCPMDMLYGVAGVSKGYANITLVYQDGSTANDIECTAMSRSLMGYGLKWSSKTSTGTAVGTRTTMAWGADTTPYSGQSYLRCYLPKADAGQVTLIQAYAVTQ
jgi:hypothetical protein